MPTENGGFDQGGACRPIHTTTVCGSNQYANDEFAFKETVAEMQQHYDKEKSEAKEKKPPQPCLSAEKECLRQALAVAQVPIFASIT